MQQEKSITGIIPVIPMPFEANEEIDEAALCCLVDFAAACGVGAICLPAYGSEFYKLSEKERLHVVEMAVRQAAGRLKVIAQSNHGSSRVALAIARANIQAGADLISIAVPRQFALSEDDLLKYLIPILNGVEVPCLVQDFNPGGPTLGTDAIVRLLKECPNFRYLKLEEAMMAPKVKALREATNDQIGILEGWGGLFMMELIPAGICGVMPGLAMADILSRVFDLRKAGRSVEAFPLFRKVLPQIVFSLQNLELYMYCEKRLLQARGLLSNTYCRSASYTPDPFTVSYVDELNEQVLQATQML